MKEVSFLRHSGWVAPEDFTDSINIVGVGATGSHIAVALAKMGAHEFHIWDHDLVEAHNLANQTYDVEHIGMSKVDALKQVLQRFNPSIRVHAHQEYFTAEEHGEDLEGPLVLTVDTMKARKDIFSAFKYNPDVPIVVETRLGFDFGELYVIDSLEPSHCSSWQASLVNDEDVPEGPCNQRICTTLVGMVASLAAHALCNYYACERKGEAASFPYRSLLNLNDGLSTYQLPPVHVVKVTDASSTEESKEE